MLERELSDVSFKKIIHTRQTKDSAFISMELAKKLCNKYKNFYLLTDCKYNIDKKVIDLLKIKKIQSINSLNIQDIKDSLFFILFSSDDLALNSLKTIIENRGFFHSLYLDPKEIVLDYSIAQSYRFTNLKCQKALMESLEQQNRISLFCLERLITHENICEALEITKDIKGDYVEIGVFHGGSALTALNYLKQINSNKKAYLLDTYEGFNYNESSKSSDVGWHKTLSPKALSRNLPFIDKEENIKSYIKQTFKKFNNYKLITNNICTDNLPEEIKTISAANIDVDMYEATYEAIKKVSKKISIGGIIMCEDAVHTPGLYGAYYAMEKFLNSSEGKNFIKIFKKNHYFLMKSK